MSLELSIFQRLLQEAILTQSEFLNKVSQAYPDREKLPDDEILVRLLELIDKTKILTLTGKANKKNRKDLENFIDDQVKAMTAEDGLSISIRDIRKLYDGIIKHLAPSENGKKKSDVSFDQCIKYADIFLKKIYPRLPSDQKSRVDKGDFSYSEVFRLVSDSQKSSKDRPADIKTVYEDEIVKIVHPMDAYSFSVYAKNNIPDIHWRDPWCTMDENQWSGYQRSKYLLIGYVKEYYKKDNPLSLISLKTNYDGKILYQDTCDYYNDHMNESLKRYLSDECIEAIESHINNITAAIKIKIDEVYNNLKSHIDINNIEEFSRNVAYIANYAKAYDEYNDITVKSIKDLSEDFRNKFYLQFSVIRKLRYGSHTVPTKIDKFIADDIEKMFLNKESFYYDFLEKAKKRNLNPAYSKQFLIAIRDIFRKREEIPNVLSFEDLVIIFENSCKSNNPEFFESTQNFFSHIILKNNLYDSEDLNQLKEQYIKSKSYATFFKENLNRIKKGLDGNFANDFIIIKKYLDQLINDAGLKELDRKAFIEKIAKANIISYANRPLEAKTGRWRILNDDNEIYEYIIEHINKINSIFNTSFNIETVIQGLSDYEGGFQSLKIANMYADKNKDILNKNYKSIINLIADKIRHTIEVCFSEESSELKGFLVSQDDLNYIVRILSTLNNSDLNSALTLKIRNDFKELKSQMSEPKSYEMILRARRDFDGFLASQKSNENLFIEMLYQIDFIKKALQTSLIIHRHNEIFSYVFNILSLSDRRSLDLFKRQLKFIKENFNTPTFIDLIKDFFAKEENGMFRTFSDEKKLEINNIFYENFKSNVFNQSSPKDDVKVNDDNSEELVKDYVKTQL